MWLSGRNLHVQPGRLENRHKAGQKQHDHNAAPKPCDRLHQSAQHGRNHHNQNLHQHRVYSLQIRDRNQCRRIAHASMAA